MSTKLDLLKQQLEKILEIDPVGHSLLISLISCYEDKIKSIQKGVNKNGKQD